MTSVILHDVQHFGNKIVAPNLEEAKISDKVPATPEPGQIYRKNGVLFYQNENNVGRPIHEDAIREIVDPEGIVDIVVGADYKATISVAPANGTKSGFITPEHYALLAGASTLSDPNTLALRDVDGNLVGWRVIADEHIIAEQDVRAKANIIAGNIVQGASIQADNPNDSSPPTSLQPGKLVGLQVPPPDDGTIPNRGSYAVSVDHLETTVETAIASANAQSAQNVANIIPTPPILATRSGQDVTLDIAPATATTPGSLSPEMFSLLQPVEASPSATLAYIGGDSEGTATLLGGGIVYIQAESFFANHRITSPSIFTQQVSGLSASPTDPTEAISLGYLQNQLQSIVAAQSGRDIKDDVYFTYDVNISLTAAPPAQDGVVAPANQSYLLTAQVNAAENGAYFWNGATWTRREDSDADSLSAGAVYPTIAGKYAGMLFMLTTATFELDTDPLNFMNASDMILSGDGLVRDGRTIHVRGKAGQIQVSADEVAIASDFAGLPSITTLGRIQEGVWDATEISVAKGGTGSVTVAGSQQNLGIEATVISVLGDGASKVFHVKHDIGTLDISVDGLYLGQSTFIDHSPIDPETVEIRASLGNTPIPTNSLRVKITGLRNGANATTVAATVVA